MKKVLAIILILFPLLSANSKLVSNASVMKYKCGLPELEWMTVQKGFDSDALIKLASDISASAKADAEKLKNAKASGDAKFSLKGEFQKTIKKAKKRGYSVTQNFFMLYKAKRDALCALDYIMHQSKRPLTDAQYDDGYKLYSSISEDFSKMADDLKSKIEQ